MPLAALPGMGGPALGAAVGNGEAAFDFTVTGPSGPATAAVVSAQCPRAGRPSSVGVAASRADHPDAAPPGRLRLAVAMVGPGAGSVCGPSSPGVGSPVPAGSGPSRARFTSSQPC